MPSNLSNKSHLARVGNKIVDHSDVVWPSPVGAAPTTSSFTTKHLAPMDCTKQLQDEARKYLGLGICCSLYQRFDGDDIAMMQVK